jgi:hypothetical protein
VVCPEIAEVTVSVMVGVVVAFTCVTSVDVTSANEVVAIVVVSTMLEEMYWTCVCVVRKKTVFVKYEVTLLVVVTIFVEYITTDRVALE